MNFCDPSGARPSRDVAEAPSFSALDGWDLPTGPAADAVAALTLAVGGVPLDQREIPCCVAIALTTAMEFVGATGPLSPLFNYFLSRRDPAVIDDVEIFDAFRSAVLDGVCARSLHSPDFDEPAALATPSSAAVEEALAHRLKPTPLGLASFGRVAIDVTEWKATISKSLPVLFGFSMSPEYDAIRNGLTTELASPSERGAGHTVLAIGFDDAAEHFIVRDSRGPAVGVAGTWNLPYARISQTFIFESWVVTAVP